MMRFFIYGLATAGLLLSTVFALDALELREYNTPIGGLMSILLILISIAVLTAQRKETWINDIIIYPFSYALGLSSIFISAGMWADWVQFGTPFVSHEYSLAGQAWPLPLMIVFDSVIAITFTAAACICIAAIGRVLWKKHAGNPKQPMGVLETDHSDIAE